jgi:L-histidine N-alpha-methyltransferase
MNFDTHNICMDNNLRIKNYLPELGEKSVQQNLVQGLAAPRKYISSMFFYDQTGSKLFENITTLPEYYPTRTEMKLIKQAVRQQDFWQEHSEIVELGSGDCKKISIILEDIPATYRQQITYIPVDVSQSAVRESALILSRKFLGINVKGIVADFMTQLAVIPNGQKRLFCFFGSTIGNLERDQANEFFRHIGHTMVPGDRLLLGIDMVKEKHILERAYNDSSQITAQFNLNVINVVNSLLGTKIEPQSFEHYAFYNEEKYRIEMHLRAKKDLKVDVPFLNKSFIIKKGETIHTENSHKFKQCHLQEFEQNAALEMEKLYTDEKQWFSLVQFKKT